MSAGGATWSTAGTLTAGATNEFAASGGVAPYRRAWWSFTTDVRSQVQINPAGTTWVGSSKFLFMAVYSGSEASPVWVTNGPQGFVSFFADPGVEYHIEGRTNNYRESDQIVLFKATATITPEPTYMASAWQTTHRDREDNYMVISYGDLLAGNSGVYASTQHWTDNVIYGRFNEMPGRLGDYLIQETLSGRANGHPAIDAVDCAVSHALWGDQGNQLWNTSMTDPDEGGSPVCAPLVEGLADHVLNNAPSYSLQHSEGGPLIAGSADAAIGGMSRALFFMPVRDNLIQFGPIGMDFSVMFDEGVPLDYTGSVNLEWEPGGLELISVEVTGDREGRPAAGTVGPEGVTFFFHDKILPAYLGEGEFNAQWVKGVPGTWDEDSEHPFLSFDYADGDPVWYELDWITSWDDCQDPAVDYDAKIAVFMTKIFGVIGVDTSAGNVSDIAVRLTFRSPRYRWIWYPTDFGRLKVNVNTEDAPVWKFAAPRPGENGGFGVLKFNVGDGITQDWRRMDDFPPVINVGTEDVPEWQDVR